jgi:hypothetical protein
MNTNAQIPMQSPQSLARAGLLPIRNDVVRFAVGNPMAKTSNGWRVWTEGPGDIYIACRDNFKETKVSLHVSGNWRFGFTSQAVDARPELVADGKNRAWEVWKKPGEFVDGVIQAFKLIFPLMELAISPEQRIGTNWKNTIYIEAGDEQVHTVLALYVTKSSVPLSFSNLKSFCLGIWDLPDGTYAQLVAQAEPGDANAQITEAVLAAKQQAAEAAVEMPETAYFLFLGQDSLTGARFLLVAQDR